METPGEYFKRERALRGVSLQKIFEVTRAPLKYLEAIEADDMDALPSQIFVKGYIRAYCKFLGLDANDAVLRYELFMKERAEKPAEQQPSFEEKAPKPNIPAIPANALKAAGVVAAAIAVIIIIYLVSTRGGGKPAAQSAKETPAEAQAPSQDVKAAEALKKDKTPAVQAKAQPGAKKDATPQSPAVPAAKTHTLTLRATRGVWVRIALDDKEPVEATLKEGESFTWRAERVFSMRFGDAGAVTLRLDGVEMGPPGKSGQVLDIRLPSDKAPALDTRGQAVKPPQAAAIKAPEEKPKTPARQKEETKATDVEPPDGPAQPEKPQTPVVAPAKPQT